MWASADADLTPLAIFVVAAETGGQVLGAFAGSRLVGFTMALAGQHERQCFLHSHMTAVLEPWRDRGIGMRLKLFQRQDALSRGIGRIEWTFDPLQVKNAYFNLVKLGAMARRYVANMYGEISSPLQGPLPTDRLIAEWDLNSARVRRAIAAGKEARTADPSSSSPAEIAGAGLGIARGEQGPAKWGGACSGGRWSASHAGRGVQRGGRNTERAGGKNAARIRIPGELAAMRQKKPGQALRMQAQIRQEFEYWLHRGYAAVSVRAEETGGEYLLEPWPEEK